MPRVRGAYSQHSMQAGPLRRLLKLRIHSHYIPSRSIAKSSPWLRSSFKFARNQNKSYRMVPWPPARVDNSTPKHHQCAPSISPASAGFSSMPSLMASADAQEVDTERGLQDELTQTGYAWSSDDEAVAEMMANGEAEVAAGETLGDEVLLGLRLEALGLRQIPADMATAQDKQPMADSEFTIITKADIPDDGRVVKSLIWQYVAGGTEEAVPIVVVLELDRKVCKQEMAAAVARWMSRRTGEAVVATDVTVGLMPREAAAEHGGYAMGNVGPLGHANPMPVVLDSRLLAKGGATSDIYAGGGAEGFELRLNLQSVMAHADAIIAPISTEQSSSNSSPKRSTSTSAKQQQQQQQQKRQEGQQRGRGGGGGPIPAASAIRKHASRPDSTEDLKRILEGLENPAEVLNRGTDQSGKTALQLAAWRGSKESVAALLDAGAEIDAYSTGMGNYGKTAIFYALTRCRDGMVELLLSRGANVLICNNKGQTPLSIAVSHVKPETVQLIEEAEARQLAGGREWLNFRATHSDGKSYGDLDPRMGLDAANGWAPHCDEPLDGVKSIRPTTIQIRRERWEKSRAMKSEQQQASPSSDDREETGYPNPSSGPRPALPTLTVGTSLCHLVGIVVSKRRIGKALMFVNLVPPPDPHVRETCAPFIGSADPATANKYAWHDASRTNADWADTSSQQQPGVAVQLIIGRTVKERVGFEAAVEILKSIRVGQLVYTTGRMWINGTRGQRNYRENSTVDIVISDIRVLQENYRIVPLPEGSEQEQPDASAESGAAGGGSGARGAKGRSRGGPSYSAEDFQAVTLGDVLDELHPDRDPPHSPISADGNEDVIDSRIRLLDTPEAMEELREAVRGVKAEVKTGGLPAARCCVAIDCEWQPGPRGGEGNPVALLQIATSSRIFLVDLQTLCRPGLDETEAMDETEMRVNSVVREIFTDKRVSVVGFGLRTDLSKLATSFPHMPCFKAAESIVDLKMLLTAVFPGSPHMSHSIGLSKLCSRLIGKKVDKSEQCSDWASRPLKPSQMTYAALDAAVLLALLAPIAQESRVCRCETEECVQSCIFDAEHPRNDIRRTWTAAPISS